MISLVYQNKKILEEIKKEFKKYNIIKLESFFNKSFYEALKEESESLKFKHKKVANQFSYSTTSQENKIRKLLSSEQFSSFIKFITGKSLSSLEIKKFGHKDYTLLHDSESQSEGIKAFIFICEKWEPDLGGNFVFTKSTGQTFYITPMENSISIVNKQKDWKEFIQYVNHLSEQREIIVIECELK